MRWFSVICLLLTIKTAILASERTKRTIPLPYLGITEKPSVADSGFLYKIPGYDNILLKVTPKKVLTNAPNNVNNALADNSSPNEICNEASSGFQKIIDLIKTGINNKKELLERLFPPPTPVNPIIIINEETKYPVIQEIEEPPPPALGIKYTETVEEHSEPIAVPMPTMIANPKEVITEVVQPTYTYKQASRDGTMMSYEFEDNPNVIVTETAVMPPLPTYIKSRFEEIVSTAVAPGMMVPGAVIKEGIRFSDPVIPGYFGNVITPLPPVASPIYPPAFARLQNMGYFEGGDIYGPPILIEEDVPVLLRSSTDIFKIPGSKGNVNVKISKIKQPMSINNKASIKARSSKINFDSNINSGTISMPDGTSRALPPPPSFRNVNSNSVSDINPSAQLPISQRSVNNVNKFEVTGNMARTNNHGSSFVYKQVRNKNMHPLHISQATPTSDLRGRKQEKSDYIASKTTKIDFVPSVEVNVDATQMNERTTSIQTQERNQGTLSPCLDVSEVAKTPLCSESFSLNDGSLKSSPIMVPDTSFVYKQLKTDGSSMSVIGNQNNVVVDVKNSISSSESRGDIP